MFVRAGTSKQAIFAQICTGKTCKRWKSAAAAPAAAPPPASPASSAASSGKAGSGVASAIGVPSASVGSAQGGKHVDVTSLYTAIPHNAKQRKSQERDFLVSVLSSSPTKRDTKKYLQTFGSDKIGRVPIGLWMPGQQRTERRHDELPQQTVSPEETAYATNSIRAVNQSPQFVQGTRNEVDKSPADDLPHVAIVKLQDPNNIDETTLEGLAKTFVQLRGLGLASVIVIGRTQPDSDTPVSERGWFEYATRATMRVTAAIDKYAGPVTSLVDSAMCIADDCSAMGAQQHASLRHSSFIPGRVYVDRTESLLQPLANGKIVVIPPFVLCAAQSEAQQVDTDDMILALTRYLSGVQQHADGVESYPSSSSSRARQAAVAALDRIIIIDPLGGTPSMRRPNGAHVFVNMEEEYVSAKAALDDMADRCLLMSSRGDSAAEISRRHKANLDLVRRTLALLPSTSSALLTTPAEAANLVAHDHRTTDEADDAFGFVGSVGTRRSQNPLIHNLLTDRPVHSSSLPISRLKPKSKRGSGDNNNNVAPGPMVEGEPAMSKTTLLKRGMPLTIYPNPQHAPWAPPKPGSPRLRLTDTCIDLPRLVHLIEDSFNRPLDVQDYLNRLENSLAGVIIAGEYDGGAILTWERPPGLDEETAYRTGRLVPYLDKFAVLKKSQGAGGVADIVFTAMVRDCFPDGVCWRSRKDNPVNRWYFERSRGTWKLDGVNWTMFWTTEYENLGEQGIRDYEAVCRGIEPSWLDQKHILD